MLSVIMLGFLALSAIVLCDIILSVTIRPILPNAVMLTVTIKPIVPTVVMLSVTIKPGVISIVMLSVTIKPLNLASLC